MKLISIVIAFVGMLPLSAPTKLAASSPCVPDGGTATGNANRPSLQDQGIPPDAQWQDGTGNPQGVEDDNSSPDDPMGPATTSDGGASASTTVTNQGGALVDQNGNAQNGGAEGDCIEVKICWTYVYKQETDLEIDVGTEWTGKVSLTIKRTVWHSTRLCSAASEVCPC